eukprot:gnl/Ergobibamus_cyprinoides/1519.p1 GENE.gnl/Ergobibamus_cyprinoides/1519~~gnl/Ergobibamus_cyprinoides/1519.p1  ORF type:complete len:102 (-),score=35.67 gnl/Ergobibamus_cyprinoides/1519:17-322(-)
MDESRAALAEVAGGASLTAFISGSAAVFYPRFDTSLPESDKPSLGMTLNAYLVGHGHAAPRSDDVASPELMACLEDLAADAKADHDGIWRYGDIDDDESDY